MDLQVEESGPLQRTLRVEIPTADVDAAFDHAYERLRRKARLKGFRPGRAPRSVLERYFADEARGDVMDHLVRDTLPKALDESELKLVSMPRVTPPGDAPRQGAPFSYEAQVEVEPQFELQKVRGLEIESVDLPEPEDDPVERYLEQRRVERAVLHPEPAQTPAAEGQVAVLQVTGTRGGEPWLEGEERTLLLGDDALVPGFDAQVLGMCEGDAREFEIELPAEDAPAEEAEEEAETAANEGEGSQPEPVVFQVQLTSLKRRELPELDDEFAKDVSEEFETLDALRADLRERFAKMRDEELLRRREQAALDALLRSNEFPVPPSLVEEQLGRRLRDTFRGLQPNAQDEAIRKLIDELAEQLRPHAERDVRAAFLMREVARSEAIEISDEQVREHVQQLARDRGQPARQVERELADSDTRDAVRQHLLERAVLGFLLEHAQAKSG